MHLFLSSDDVSHDCSSDSQSESSSDLDSSESSHSESFEESSSSDLSVEPEDLQEEQHMSDSSEDCIIVSSDEELMQMETPMTPLAPQTPGAELDLCLQNWPGPFNEEDAEDGHCTSCHEDTFELDSVAFQSSDFQEYPHPLSLVGFPGCMIKVLCCSD